MRILPLPGSLRRVAVPSRSHHCAPARRPYRARKSGPRLLLLQPLQGTESFRNRPGVRSGRLVVSSATTVLGRSFRVGRRSIGRQKRSGPYDNSSAADQPRGRSGGTASTDARRRFPPRPKRKLNAVNVLFAGEAHRNTSGTGLGSSSRTACQRVQELRSGGRKVCGVRSEWAGRWAQYIRIFGCKSDLQL
jgi:hypothetical protein